MAEAIETRARTVHELLRDLWTNRPGLKAARKLFLAAIKTEEAQALKPPLTAGEVKVWVRDEPRRQAFYRPQKEWPGRNQISNAPGVRLNADLLDWSEYTPNPAANAGYRYVLFVQDPHTRYAYARPVRNKGQDVIRAIQEIFAESGKPKQIVHDKGGEFISRDWINLMEQLGM